MVRKDSDDMKEMECMNENNPTGFRTKTDLFEEAMDAYEKRENITLGVDLARGPDGTTEHPRPVRDATLLWHDAKVVNTTYNVNVRAEPSLESPIVGRIHPDSEFMILAIRNPNWYKVTTKDGVQGYVTSKYVAKVMPDEHT